MTPTFSPPSQARVEGRQLPPWLIFPVAVIGVCVSFASFFLIQRLEQQEASTHFHHAARDIAFFLQRSIDGAWHQLEAHASLFAASDKVERREFHQSHPRFSRAAKVFKRSRGFRG